MWAAQAKGDVSLAIPKRVVICTGDCRTLPQMARTEKALIAVETGYNSQPFAKGARAGSTAPSLLSVTSDVRIAAGATEDEMFTGYSLADGHHGQFAYMLGQNVEHRLHNNTVAYISRLGREHLLPSQPEPLQEVSGRGKKRCSVGDAIRGACGIRGEVWR